MKILFVTNVPSPYRIDFFNELGKYCDLTVCFERKSASDRHEKWKGTAVENFKSVELNLKPHKEDRSRGNEIRDYVKQTDCDLLIFTNYVSPATMKAISYCRRKNKKYFIEYDGGFYKVDSLMKKIVKKYLLCGAEGHFTTCEEHKKYLMSIGIHERKIWKYPFTSVVENDLTNARGLLAEGKETLRKKLGIEEDRVVISVGRFVYIKGFDILLNAVNKIDRTIGVYIVGGDPTEEYLNMQKEFKLDNVHFIGFKTKPELAEYYAASDLYVMPTREDVWGLVVNEAMSFGLPVISSDACNAALEMVKNGENGYIVPSENVDELANKIELLMSDEEKLKTFSENCLEVIKQYTVEKMAQRHYEIFKEIIGE